MPSTRTVAPQTASTSPGFRSASAWVLGFSRRLRRLEIVACEVSKIAPMKSSVAYCRAYVALADGIEEVWSIQPATPLVLSNGARWR